MTFPGHIEQVRIQLLLRAETAEARVAELEQHRREDVALMETTSNTMAKGAEMIKALRDLLAGAQTPKPIEDYHEDDGAVLWWKLPVVEPPYVGFPDDSDWIEDYYTHWTRLILPIDPNRP